MAVVTSDLLSASLTAARSIFNDTFAASMPEASYLKFCLDGRVQDTGGHASVQYGWLTEPPKMQRWTGELAVDDLRGYDFTLTNYLYTGSFGVDRLAFERDQLGMIPPKTRQLVDEAIRFRGEKIFDLINGGGSAIVESPTFDSAAFFADRTIGDSGTIDNTIATAGTSAANFRTDLAAATARMMNFKDSRGRPINRAPNVIVIPPDDLAAAWEALSTGPGATEPGVPPSIGLGTTSFEARGYTVVVSAYISDTGGRYFFHTSPGWAPFIIQQEITPQFEGITTPNSESGVLHERYVYKARDVFAVGFGDPRLAIYTT